MSDTDAAFPPSAPKLGLAVEAGRELRWLVDQLNDYEDHDLYFTAAGDLAVPHTLKRVPASFEIIWLDADANVYALPSSGWGYNVVYFSSSAAARVRIRLR